MRLALWLLFWLATSPVFAVGTQGYVNALDYGVVGDGVTDDQPAIQNILDNVLMERGTIYFPAKDYRVNATIDCGGRAFNFRGDGRPMPYNAWINGSTGVILGGTIIRGNFAGPLLKAAYPGGMLSIQDMGFANQHAAGAGLDLSGSQVALQRVSVYAYRGIATSPNSFTVTMEQIVVRGLGGAATGGFGIAVSGHTLLHGADIALFDKGLLLAGVGNDVRSLRVEVCRTAVEIGTYPDGSLFPMQGSTLESFTMEANDYGLVVRAATAVSVRGGYILGTTNAPSGYSKVGVQVGFGQWVSFEQIITHGAYDTAAIKVMPSQATTVPLRFQLCRAGNGHPTAPKWDTRPPDAMLALEQCS